MDCHYLYVNLEDGSPGPPLHSTLFMPAPLQCTVSDGNENCVGIQTQDPPKTCVNGRFGFKSLIVDNFEVRRKCPYTIVLIKI